MNTRDLLKICVKMGSSWSAQSGPEAFLDFCFLKTRFTSSTKTLSAGRMVGEGGRGLQEG